MRIIERLKREARKAAELRGHKLGKFGKIERLVQGDGVETAWCSRCDRRVLCIARPRPNEIQISGEAVALNCQGTLDVKAPEAVTEDTNKEVVTEQPEVPLT